MLVRQLAAITASLVLAAPAVAQCNGGCAVGALGNGGTASEGQAEGFRYVGPGPLNAANTLVHDGVSSAGHVEVLDANGNVIGILNGRCEAGTFVWTGTGSGIFGDWTGSGVVPFVPCN